ncbi:MAG TPA: hypothetical protein VFV07_12415 [Rhizomicrobium sp.]|nr:hypothetical protein [Rhizomicrobium sp.]
MDFKLFCKGCGHTAFRISSFPKTAPNPSPYFGIAPGQVLLLPPHDLVCGGCGTRARLFDARSDGYDGVLNGGCTYESGEGEDALSGEEYVFVIGFGYSIEWSELAELAQEAGVDPADLFDSIVIGGTSPGGGQDFSLDYECA